MWQTPCHLPELGLTARLQTGAWVGLNHEGRVWGTGEWASAPRPGCRHCSLSHRLVATALGTASLHPSLPPLGEEETEAQGPQPSHGHTHRAWSLCPEPCPPPSHPSGLSVCSQRLGQQDASPRGALGCLRPWEWGLDPSFCSQSRMEDTLEKHHGAGLFVEAAAVRDEQTPHLPRVPREPPHRLGRGHSLICDLPDSLLSSYSPCVWGLV